jgi:hypothetical protein
MNVMAAQAAVRAEHHCGHALGRDRSACGTNYGDSIVVVMSGFKSCANGCPVAPHST